MGGRGGGGKGNSYNGLYGEAPPERGTFFMIQVHESCVGITLVEVHERVEKSVISVFKRAQNGQQMHIMAVKEPRKLSGFVIYSYLKESAFTAVKRDAMLQTRSVKGVPFVNRRYTKGVPFLPKMVYSRVRG